MSENLRHLQALVLKKSAVEWFKGLFRHAHLEVKDTGERFTIVHHGDRAEVLTGFQADDPNFVIPLHSTTIRALADAFSDDTITAQEEYRIVRFMLKPCLKAALQMPILRNKALLKIVKVDTHWQEALLDPQGNEDEPLTVIYVNKQWLVIAGYHGQPQRRWRVTPAQLLEFQRRVLEADEANKLSAWLKLGRWYVKWREAVTATG